MWWIIRLYICLWTLNPYVGPWQVPEKPAWPSPIWFMLRGCIQHDKDEGPIAFGQSDKVVMAIHHSHVSLSKIRKQEPVALCRFQGERVQLCCYNVWHATSLSFYVHHHTHVVSFCLFVCYSRVHMEDIPLAEAWDSSRADQNGGWCLWTSACVRTLKRDDDVGGQPCTPRVPLTSAWGGAGLPLKQPAVSGLKHEVNTHPPGRWAKDVLSLGDWRPQGWVTPTPSVGSAFPGRLVLI